MKIRRIVTGHDDKGRSIFVSDAAVPRTSEFKHVPGFEASLLWETSPDARVPTRRDDPTVSARSWVPTAGGTNLMFITFPPDTVMSSEAFDPARAGAEYMELLPGLAETFELEHPGMHTTETIDYGVLLDGELDLELDNGQTRTLGRYDVVVQNGTRHAWRNRSDRSSTMVFVLIGARRTNRVS